MYLIPVIGMPGLTEILIILLIVAVIFGAGRLPQIGDGLGRAIRNFKRSVTGDNEVDVTPKQVPPGDDDD